MSDLDASSSTMKPVSASSITSGTEPRLNAITGVPQLIASIITKPNGSGQSIGIDRPTAPAERMKRLVCPMRQTCRADAVAPILTLRNLGGLGGETLGRA